jgi:hypothetical protein
VEDGLKANETEKNISLGRPAMKMTWKKEAIKDKAVLT